MTLVGSQAASLTSVLIAQLFASSFNDDKKLLTFSDSVQDAAHRAGFFAARTWKFNFRAALLQCIAESGQGMSLTELPKAFIRYTVPQRSLAFYDAVGKQLSDQEMGHES